MNLPKQVKIVEVGPRDGLQNETKTIPTDIKISLINQLSETGLKTIEATSFVSPKWIPQLADHKEVMKGIKRHPDISYPVLVPNMKGFERALEANVKEIAVFSAASETFTKKNINQTISESLKYFKEIMTAAKHHKIRVRGYISCVMGCPYEGEIDPHKVAEIAEMLTNMGCYEISLGDTIGAGNPIQTEALITIVADKVATEQLAVHFHDTFGLALTNIYTALQKGITTVDSSISGLGGCPYAHGATGNVATEDVLNMLNGLDIETGININDILNVGDFISGHLGRNPRSKASEALPRK